MENIKYPICPINLYWEGDENICDVDKCDFDDFSQCSMACRRTKMFVERKTLEIFFHDLNQEARDKVLEFYDLEFAEDGNLDVCPLFVLECEDDES